MKTRTVLAVPHTELNTPYVGLLQPVFDIRGGETYKSDPLDYPNRGFVFTPSAFAEINEAFPPGTLVQLDIEENHASSLPSNHPDFARFILCKNGWGEPDRWAVQLVVDAPFSKDKRTIILDEVPRHPIWLRDPEKKRLYGPFDTTATKLPTGEVSVQLQPPTMVPFAPERDEHSIASLSERAVETVEVEGVEYVYFTREEFAKKTVEWVDFSTDEVLLELIRDLAGTSAPLAPEQLERLRDLLASGVKVDARFTKERVKRAAALLDQASQWQDHRHALIEEYLATERGAEHVERYLDAHQEELVDRAFHKHHGQVLERVQQHTRTLAELASEVHARKAEIAELQKVDTDALRARRAALESELQGLRDEVAELREQVEAGNALLDLKAAAKAQAADYLAKKAELEKLRRERDELQQVSARLRKEAQRDLSDLRSRLTSIKPYVDSLTGAAVQARPQREIQLPRVTRQAPASLPALVDKMHDALMAANHRVAKRDVANAFTGILTSPLTILAGLPGVGKTSLITRLAEVLGMAQGSQFLTVRVPRGWRSRQDILGYHNPITGDYERAPTGLYALLEHHQKSDTPVPSWVLFDEANLSAPEHYLSDFLGMMDEVADRTLATGAPGEIFTVPQHLRFIFTINQDHSVEALTPRVLDRAAVIYVPPPESFEAANTYTNAAFESDGTLSMEMLDKLLESVPNDLTPSEDATLKRIIKVLHDNNPSLGVPTRISPRKHRRVLRHTTTLRHILGVNAGLDALDNAVATHVLPLVRGSGNAYRARLDALAREVESLQVSHVLLNRIIAAGEASFDEYNFQTLA